MPESSARRPSGAFAALRGREDVTKLLAMMGLSFVVIFVVGVLRPIRDAIALDGLEPGDFYQVYFVSAVVLLFVPLYNRLADRIPLRRLIPRVALFFAASMVLFRFLYQPGVAFFGLAFYGWYDLMVAALITQFFMATQIFYNARDAKRAYPMVIAAGSLGAAVGGGITAFFAQRLGTPNLLLVAAAAIVVFAVGISIVWAREDPEEGRGQADPETTEFSAGEFKRIFSNRQVRLIAITVLLTVLVKQFVDYEYKTLTREVYTDLDALSGFLGLVDAATQWLPILVLLALRPILRRWGAGVAVIIFPAAMIFATGALAASLTLAVAVVARTSERMFRYSAERTGREILYVPVPDDIKFKAKAYIDVGVEKGIGKALSGVLLAIPAITLASMTVRNRLVVVALAGLALAALLLFVFLRVRRQYVLSLARSFEGRSASLRGTYISLSESGALDLARQALRTDDPLKLAFTLELLRDAEPEDIERVYAELHDLTGHEEHQVRSQALSLLARSPEAVVPARVQDCLSDPVDTVREAAVLALVARAASGATRLMERFLASEDPRVRTATLACLSHDVPPEQAETAVGPYFARLQSEFARGDLAEENAIELATAAGLVGENPDAIATIRTLIGHPDPAIGRAAFRSAGRLGDESLIADLLGALISPRTRVPAAAALAERGEPILGHLITALNDPAADPWIRRGAARVLGEIPALATVDALITSYLLPETEQALDDRALASLARIRSSGADIQFPRDRIDEATDREIAAAARYGDAAAQVEELEPTRAQVMLVRALREARDARQAAVFHWLGLVYAPHGMHRSHATLTRGGDRQRANALEWVENTVGHTRFVRLTAMWDLPSRPGGDGGPDVEDLLRELWDDEDTWIARCAFWTSFETAPAKLRSRLSGYAPSDPGLERAVARIETLTNGGARGDLPEHARGDDMDLIEKVFLLQNVDLLSGVRSQQLSLLAAIAREIDVAPDRVVIRKGEPTDALYVVIRGEVALEGMGDQRIIRTDGEAFGTWALIDDHPSLVEARALKDTRLLRIVREDFHDLLIDDPELGLDLLQGLARRVRTLATA